MKICCIWAKLDSTPCDMPSSFQSLLYYLQWCALENQQSPFYVVNELTLTGRNPSLKFCKPLELLRQLKKGFRSFDSENLGSVGQRAAKLLAIRLWEWFDPGRSRIWDEGACRLFGHKGRRVYKRKVWWLVTLQPFELQTPNFQNQKI